MFPGRWISELWPVEKKTDITKWIKGEQKTVPAVVTTRSFFLRPTQIEVHPDRVDNRIDFHFSEKLAFPNITKWKDVFFC